MNLLNTNNEKNHSILSATKPVEPVLKTDYKEDAQLQTRLKQRKIIKVYDENGKYYIDHSTAYALGLIKTRAIMLEKPKLVELPNDLHSKLKLDDTIDIEYIKVERKQPLKVYVDGSSYCVDLSAAYALGLISVEDFNNLDNKYYYLDIDTFERLKSSYTVELYALSLKTNKEDKKL